MESFSAPPSVKYFPVRLLVVRKKYCDKFLFVATWFTTVFVKKLTIDKNLVKDYKFIFYQIYALLVITFEPETIESQSKVEKTRIIA